MKIIIEKLNLMSIGDNKNDIIKTIIILCVGIGLTLFDNELYR